MRGKCFAGIATENIPLLSASAQGEKETPEIEKTSTEETKGRRNNLHPDETKRVKLHSVKCPKYKANLMIRPTEKVCPVCGSALPRSEKR